MLIASTHAAQSHTLAFLWTMIRGIACLIVKGIFTAILLPERLATWSFRPSQHVLAYVIHIMWNITSARLQPKSDTCRSWSMTLDIPCVIVKREAALLSDRIAAAPLLSSDTSILWSMISGIPCVIVKRKLAPNGRNNLYSNTNNLWSKTRTIPHIIESKRKSNIIFRQTCS